MTETHIHLGVQTYPPPTQLQQDVDKVTVLEETVKLYNVFVTYAAMNGNLLRHLHTQNKHISNCIKMFLHSFSISCAFCTHKTNTCQTV